MTGLCSARSLSTSHEPVVAVINRQTSLLCMCLCRQQRLARAAAKQSPGQAASPASRGRAKSKAAGRGRTTRTRRPQSKHPSVTTSWDELPIPVLTQIFQAVCKHGALPMAPRLACVCTSWQAAVAATPELWRILDTGAISSKAWVQQNAQGRGRGPKAARAKGKARGASAARFVSAEQGLRQWLESGRLQQLQVLVLHGEGPAGPTADVSALESESSRSGPNRQLSPGLLMQIADTCQQLRRVSLFGCLSWRPEVGPTVAHHLTANTVLHTSMPNVWIFL